MTVEVNEPAPEDFKIPDTVKFAILALSPITGSVLHFCGYKTKPDYGCYINLFKELKDPDSGFDLQNQDFVLVPAEEEDLEKIKATIDKLSDKENV